MADGRLISSRIVAFSGTEAKGRPEARADWRRASGTAGLIHSEAVPAGGTDGVARERFAVGDSVGGIDGVTPNGWKGVEVAVESSGATTITVGA